MKNIIFSLLILLLFTACGDEEIINRDDTPEPEIIENTVIPPAEEEVSEPPAGVAEPEAPGESDDNDDGFSGILLNEHTYTLPAPYTAFTNRGWVFTGDGGAMVEPQGKLLTQTFVFPDTGLVCYTDIINFDIVERPLYECHIFRITMDSYTLKQGSATAGLPTGVTIDASLAEDVRVLLGEPSAERTLDSGTQLFEYLHGDERTVQLTFGNKNGTLSKIAVTNGLVPVDFIPSAMIPNIVKQYVQPEDFGGFEDFIVNFGGAFYQLPAPVSAFTRNGWEVKSGPESVGGSGYDWITLEKDGRTMHTAIQNYTAESTAVINCFITSLSTAVDENSTPLTIGGGIGIGDRREDLLAALDGTEYKEAQTADSYIYTLAPAPGNSVDKYSITVSRSAEQITKIEVTNAPKYSERLE